MSGRVYLTLSALSSRASTWAFLTGLMIAPTVGAVQLASSLNFKSGFYDYSAFAMCASVVTCASYWLGSSLGGNRRRAQHRGDF